MAQAGDAAVAQRFNVQKAPTLLVLFPDASRRTTRATCSSRARSSTHGCTASSTSPTWRRLSGVVDMGMQQREGGRRRRRPAGGSSSRRELRVPKDVGPPPELTADNFESECVAKGGLCGIALLDGSAENAASKENRSRCSPSCAAARPAARSPFRGSTPPATSTSSRPLAFRGGPAHHGLPLAAEAALGALGGRLHVETLERGRQRRRRRPALDGGAGRAAAPDEVDRATVKRGADAYVEEDDGAADIMAEILEEEAEREAREAELAAEGAAMRPRARRPPRRSPR